MAGTYGEPGKNPFQLKGISGILSPVVNAESGTIQIYKQGATLQFQSLGTLDPKTNKFTKDEKNSPNLTEGEIKALSGQEGVNNIKNAAKTATVQGIKDGGGTVEEAQSKADKLMSPNSSTDQAIQESQAQIEKEKVDIAGNSRNQFPKDLRYPEKLQISQQDVIKFSMVKYSPKKTKTGGDLNPIEERRRITDELIIGSVYLPIPGGISDTNSVTWGSDTLDPLRATAANIANSFITGGGAAGTKSAEGAVGGVSENSTDFKTKVANYFTEAATGTSNLLSRTQGLITNPNMELLFQAPTLRPFTFNFKLSARGVGDREQIRQIIRLFKQGMAVQRSKSQLFLKAPHTFKIQYLHKQKDHPYINKIKECALLSFTVNYTPEGNYMTFADGLMTSYEISMQFQELEPIFNDDYENVDGKSLDSEIGY